MLTTFSIWCSIGFLEVQWCAVSPVAYLKNFMLFCNIYTSKIKAIQLLFHLAVFLRCMVIPMGNVQCEVDKLLASGLRHKYCSDN